MRHRLTTVMECMGMVASVCGAPYTTLGLSQTFLQQYSPNEEFMLAMGCGLVVIIPTLLVGLKADKKYEDSPYKIFCGTFLLASSCFVLSYVLDKFIVSTFVPSLDPFNLPMMLSGGASTCVIAGLGLLAQDPIPSPFSSLSKCASSFFSKCVSVKNQGDSSSLSNLPNTTTPLSSVSSEHYAAILEGVDRPVFNV